MVVIKYNQRLNWCSKEPKNENILVIFIDRILNHALNHVLYFYDKKLDEKVFSLKTVSCSVIDFIIVKKFDQNQDALTTSLELLSSLKIMIMILGINDLSRGRERATREGSMLTPALKVYVKFHYHHSISMSKARQRAKRERERVREISCVISSSSSKWVAPWFDCRCN